MTNIKEALKKAIIERLMNNGFSYNSPTYNIKTSKIPCYIDSEKCYVFTISLIDLNLLKKLNKEYPDKIKSKYSSDNNDMSEVFTDGELNPVHLSLYESDGQELFFGEIPIGKFETPIKRDFPLINSYPDENCEFFGHQPKNEIGEYFYRFDQEKIFNNESLFDCPEMWTKEQKIRMLNNSTIREKVMIPMLK